MAEGGIFREYFQLQQQYQAQYGDKTVILYALGTFYEVWEYDPGAESDQVITGELSGNVALQLSFRESGPTQGLARKVARVLGMNLTSKSSGKPHSFNNPYMVGFPTIMFPVHKDTLLLAGFTLIRVDQTQKIGKGFKREVVEILSPATDPTCPVPDSAVCSNALAGIYLEFVQGGRNLQRSVLVAGLTQVNLLTGASSVSEVYSREGDETYILQEINRFLISLRPSQILIYLHKFPSLRLSEYQKYLTSQLELEKFSSFSFFTDFDPRCLDLSYQEQFLLKIFPYPGKKVIKSPGSEVMERLKLDKSHYGRISYLLLLSYCQSQNEALLVRLLPPRVGWIDSDRLLVLHNNASDQLDLFPKERNLTGILSRGSELDCLLAVLDHCCTPMGSRFLRNRMMSPLTNPEILEIYYDITQYLLDHPELAQKLVNLLKQLPDLEVLQRKVQLEQIQPKELASLLNGYDLMAQLDQLICEIPEFEPILVQTPTWDTFLDQLEQLQAQVNLEGLKTSKLVKATLKDSAQIQVQQSFLRRGHFKEIDRVVEELESNWDELNSICAELTLHAGTVITAQLERRTKKELEQLPGPPVQVRILTTEARGRLLKKHGVKASKFNSKSVQISSPAIEELSFEIEALHQNLEDLLIKVYLDCLNRLQAQNFFGALRVLACQLDFLTNNALISKQYKYSRPQVEFCQEGSYLEAEQLRHPLVERISSSEYQPGKIKVGKGPYGILVYGTNSVGKCFGINTEIMLFDGCTDLVQNVKVGDQLMGDDSKPRNVLSTTRGKGPLYKIHPVRGEPFIVNGHHILVLKNSAYTGVMWSGCENRYRVKWMEGGRNRYKSFTVKDPAKLHQYKSNYETKESAYQAAKEFTKTIQSDYGQIVEMTVNEYLSLTPSYQKNFYLYKVGVDFPDQPVKLDPYILGYWLGDGTSSEPAITTVNHEVLQYFIEELASIGLEPSNRGPIGYYFKKADGVHVNLFMKYLRKYNLINNKHIPDKYLFNSREVRLAVLAGIIDSDGAKCRNGFDVTFKSKQLMEDLIYLARSLGYMCFMKKCKKTCTNGKNGPVEGIYYRTYITGENLSEIPLLLKYKTPDTVSGTNKYDHSIIGFHIESIGEGDYFGFEVDGNKRFLLGDFTVTHNSSTIKAAALVVIMAQMGCFVPGKIKLGLFRRIITRLSGNDNLLKGQSSFVVEMMELKIILSNADQYSLVLGDELSRGTESGSGTGLTVAAIEELCKRKSCFLFATHMHQLVEIPVIQTLVQQGLLWIGHLSSVYDAELQTLVYDRVLREGSGSSNYGLEILKALGFPEDFIGRSIQHRQQYLGTTEPKRSRYNSQIYLDKCAKCGSKTNLQTHHLKEQHLADSDGMIGNMHKNSSGNLLVLCQSCHTKHHQGKLDFVIKPTPIGNVVV